MKDPIEEMDYEFDQHNCGYDEEEAREEEAYFQAKIAEMKPFLMNGRQLLVNKNGEWGVNRYGEPVEGAIYPVWEDKNGDLTARVYHEGWDWLFLNSIRDDDAE